MFLAELTCTDEECELTLEAVGPLDYLESLVCEGCGCCMQIVSLSEHAEVPAPRLRCELPQAA